MARKKAAEKRDYVQSSIAIEEGIPCSHCGHRFDHKVTHTYPNGNRRRTCGQCSKPFISRRPASEND